MMIRYVLKCSCVYTQYYCMMCRHMAVEAFVLPQLPYVEAGQLLAKAKYS